MKKLCIVLGFMAFGITADAQEIRLSLYSAYAFDDHVESYSNYDQYFYGTMKGGFLWGGGLEYKPSANYGIELMYKRIDSKAPLRYNSFYNFEKSAELDYAANYIMLGSQRYLVLADGMLEPYFGLLAGMVIFDLENPVENQKGTYTKFAWGARAGAVVWPSDVIGIRAEFQLSSAVQSAGGGLYVGTGGSGVGVSTYSTIFQASIGGGLVFKFNTGGVAQ
jgi:hypothetical protein